MQPEEIQILRDLVGDLRPAEIDSIEENIERFLSPNLGIFVPSIGPCRYALSPNHTHPAYSFVYYTYTSAELLVKGRAVAYENTDQSTICALAPEVPHQEIVEDRFCTYIAVFIRRDTFETAFSLYPDTTMPAMEGSFHSPEPRLLSLLRGFMEEYENRLPGWESNLASLTGLIAHSIIRSLLGIREGSPRIDVRMDLENAIAYIHRHFMDKITARKLASVAYKSVPQFNRIFKDNTGVTPMEYVWQVRLDKARKALRNPEASVTRTAMDCGFASASHFSRLFAMRFKTSPSEYRSRIK